MKNVLRLTNKDEAEGLTIVDYAFAFLRAIVIAGGLLWILFHPFPLAVKSNLIYIFLVFIVYSVFLQFVIFTYPSRVEKVYFAALILDMVFIGLFIRLSGGFNSNVFLAFYLLVALHSFYYGLSKGLTLALASSLTYTLIVFDELNAILWTDMILRAATMFVIAGFLGFLSEKTRHDKNEMLKAKNEMKGLEANLTKAYNNLQDVKKQVEQSEKLASIGRLVAELAHEINNPLDGIKNCLNVLMIETEDAVLRERYFQLMQEGIREIEQTVMDLLEYAKQHEFKLEPVDINEVIKRTILMGEYKFNKQGINVRTNLNGQPLDVIGDSHHLQQVFFNIIFNAIDAMPNGGMLTIETRKENGFAAIEITDSGTGISKKDLSKIFMPFYTTKKLGEGTGLGLPISMGIVKRHNGQMDVYSYVNMGTCFRITLPDVQAFGSYKL
ncbi:MAG: hypothetical protein HZB79_01935 [Deltaproteobacteria bacterium]|nr:hypothetical protein [Deltaproteobacteria bacterium]